MRRPLFTALLLFVAVLAPPLGAPAALGASATLALSAPPSRSATLPVPGIASASGTAAMARVPALALGAVSQGLPRRAPEPRTLHEFWPVFAGFAATWIGIIAYLLSFSARLRRLADLMDGDAAGGCRTMTGTTYGRREDGRRADAEQPAHGRKRATGPGRARIRLAWLAALFALSLGMHEPGSATASRSVATVAATRAQVETPARGAVAETAPAQAGASTAEVQPRSLRTYWHVFGAFGLTWALLFGYVVSLGRRFGRLEREVRTLRRPAG